MMIENDKQCRVKMFNRVRLTRQSEKAAKICSNIGSHSVQRFVYLRKKDNYGDHDATHLDSHPAHALDWHPSPSVGAPEFSPSEKENIYSWKRRLLVCLAGKEG